MNLNLKLKRINSVTENSRVNVLITFNDDYSLLIEGSFRVCTDSDLQFTSDDYINSDFDPEYLKKIQALLEQQSIKQAFASTDTGSLMLELENGINFESYFGSNDYESWELQKSSRVIYGSECGRIIHY